MDNVNELKGLLKEVVSENQKDLMKEIKEEQNEKFNKFLESNKELAARIEKLESAPAKKVNMVDPTSGEEKEFIYKGYDLRNGRSRFSLAKEEDKDRIAKFMIDVITKQSMNSGENAYGGYMVPEEWASSVFALVNNFSFAFRDCQIVPMSTDTLNYPVQIGDVTTTLTAELTAATETAPSFSTVQLVAKRFDNLVPVSNELLEDSAFDVVSILTESWARSLAKKVDSEVLYGATAAFTGILSGSTCTVSCASTASSPNRYAQIADASELSLLEATLSQEACVGAKWYLPKVAMHYIRTLTDDNGRFIFDNMGNTIWQYPFEVSDQFTAAPAAGAALMGFGNLKNYLLGVRKKGLEIKMDPYYGMGSNITRFYMNARLCGAPAHEKYFGVLKAHA